MTKVTKEMVDQRLASLRLVTKTPAAYMVDGKIQVGYLAADHNDTYGGWALSRVVSEGGSETTNIFGFYGRHPTGVFYAMLGVAIACLRPARGAHDGF